MRKTFYIFLLFTTGFLFAEYKNTNGVASDKSFGDMLQWIRSDIEPEITKIELSSDWQKLNLSEDDNYAIWIGHSTFLIKKSGVTILTDPIFCKKSITF
jgi:N-acyl-phosphatidylethanolamine-hydrolysing phospholipase D